MVQKDAGVLAAGAREEPSFWMRLEKRLGLLEDLHVVPFPSHGRRDWIRLQGRVVENTGVKGSAKHSGVKDNVLDAIRRFKSDEIPGAEVRARFGGAESVSVTDKEGYFNFRMDVDEPVEPGWHEVPLEVDPPFPDRGPLHAEARVLIPPEDAAFAVVSDLDDTVIKTHATDLLGEIRMIFANNARTRPPFPGVAALYRALEQGPGRTDDNPFFYVSLSGWNLYDLFDEFMEFNDIPRGAFFMQDLGLIEEASPAIGTADPKLERVGILMENYPELPFVLIGDSGQEDPENYVKVVDRHPNRVKAIYIRDVSPDERDEQVEALAEQLEDEGVPMVLARDSVAVAEHAAEIGLVPADTVDDVRKEVEEARREAEED